ncbi:hypothetical protein CJ030_MR1G000541 [Morella rubra]|uniref:Uncharacterized protein n=1 Tax=Morella rubra TaxID=262757 RepID=A0A6A1WQM5_9ROSI|nr:hypothetical protein CJ030_MR1G000541 [Morella rubra]
MTCHGPSHDTPSSAMTYPTALPRQDKGLQGHKPRHDSREAYGEAMHDNSGGVEDQKNGATTRPSVLAVQPKVYGELIQDGSQGQVELFGSTTKQPLNTASHGGAHRRLVSKDSGDHRDHFYLTALHGSVVVAKAVEHDDGNHQAARRGHIG